MILVVSKNPKVDYNYSWHYPFNQLNRAAPSNSFLQELIKYPKFYH